MNIKINDDNVVVTVLGLPSETELKDQIEKLISSLCSEISLPMNLISEVNINPIKIGDGFFGMIACPSCNPIEFNIIIKNTVIWDCFDVNKPDEKKKIAKAIIIHELYHCKENYITSLNTNLDDIMKHPPVTTTRLLMLDIGHVQFSEYYAHRNSSLISYEIKNDMKLIYNTHVELLALQERTKNCQYDFSFNYEEIHSFIKYVVKYVAIYSCSHDERFRILLDTLEKDYPLICKYIKFIFEILDVEYLNYPENASKEKFSLIGKSLLSIYQYYNLYFTDDNVQNVFTVKYIIKTE